LKRKGDRYVLNLAFVAAPHVATSIFFASTTQPKMSAGPSQSHKLLAEKLAGCIQHIKTNGFRLVPDFMKQLFIEFPKGQGGITEGPHQTVMQTFWSFFNWSLLKPVLDGIATNSMMEKDKNRDGVVPDYCISPDISIAPGSPIIFQHPCH
jgi:hypothetical protein